MSNHSPECNDRCDGNEHFLLGDLVGALNIPAAARLRPGDLIRVLGPQSWELVEPLTLVKDDQ